MNRDSIIKEARTWLSMEQEGIDIYSKEEFLSWLKRSLEHQQIFEEEKSFRESIYSLPNQYKQQLSSQTRKELKQERSIAKLKRIAPIAAGFLLILTVYLFTKEKILYIQTIDGKNIIQDITMPDDSKITLDAKTDIKVCYTDKKRKVLLKQGKAFFEVSFNKNRPFFVQSDSIVVQVIGTKFEVMKEQKKVKIAVKEGIVAVRYGKDESSKLLMRLEKGDVADISTLGKVENLNQVSIEKLSAWKERKLIFDQTPLDEVVEQFSKYSDKNIELKFIDSNKFPITGEFNVYGLEKFLEFLPLIYPLEIQKENSAIKILKKSS